MLIYVGIFLGISAAMSFTVLGEQKKDSVFNQAKANIVFINEEDAPFINGLKQELSKIANFIEIPDEINALQDALYFREVTYILRVPDGFTKKFMNGEDVKLEKTVVPDAYSNVYIDLAINKYLDTAKFYLEHAENISEELLVQNLSTVLSLGSTVELKEKEENLTGNEFLNFYFNYFPYAMLYILILGTSTLIFVFNDNDLKKRNLCSPLSVYSINFQFMLAILVFMVISWLIMVGFCFVFDFKNCLKMNTLFLITNSFVFTLAAACMSFLIGNLVKGRGAITAVSNVVSLGFSFISGVFVPQQMLGSFVLKIASFNPTYWYIKANNNIVNLTDFSFIHINNVLYNMLIQIGFALIFFITALVLGKKKALN